MPQAHVCVLWLPEVGMVLSPKKYVLLRAKVLEMNSKSLEVDDAEEHGYGSSATGHKDRAWGKGLRLKWRASCRARELVRARTRLLHICKLAGEGVRG